MSEHVCVGGRGRGRGQDANLPADMAHAAFQVSATAGQMMTSMQLDSGRGRHSQGRGRGRAGELVFFSLDKDQMKRLPKRLNKYKDSTCVTHTNCFPVTAIVPGSTETKDHDTWIDSVCNLWVDLLLKILCCPWNRLQPADYLLWTERESL